MDPPSDPWGLVQGPSPLQSPEQTRGLGRGSRGIPWQRDRRNVKVSFNININPSEVLQERTVPRERCPGGRWAWRGPASGRGNRPGITWAPRGRAGLEPGQQQRQGQQGQQPGLRGGGRAPQRGLVGLSGRRALGAGQAAPGAAQLLQVPLELDLAGLLAQRLPDGGRFHGASRQHLAGAGVEVIPGPGGEGGSRGRCWWQVTPPSQRLPQGTLTCRWCPAPAPPRRPPPPAAAAAGLSGPCCPPG